MSPEDYNPEDFIPDMGEEVKGSLAGGLDELKKQGIVKLYRDWIGKSQPTEGNRTESIMISCPRPDHPDHNPSAWLNSVKDVWYCGACDTGGDVMDLASIKFDSPDYKNDPKKFVELLEDAMISQGIDPRLIRGVNAELQVTNQTTPPNGGAVMAASEDVHPVAPSASGDDPTDDDDDSDGLERSPLPWQEIVDAYPDSFLARWMMLTSDSDLPNEYLFWTGMELLSLAAGRRVHLDGGISPIYGNLLVTLVGGTGIGKSRSVQLGKILLNDALPFDSTGTRYGVRMLPRPGSGERLYEMFHWVPDGCIDPAAMTGFIEVDELAELMNAAGRRGSTLQDAVTTLYSGSVSGTSSMSSGTAEPVDPYMVMITGTQPKVISKIMNGQHAASGFANRFVFVEGTKKTRTKWVEQKPIDPLVLSPALQDVATWCSIHEKGPDGGSIVIQEIGTADKLDEHLDYFELLKERTDGDIFARIDLHLLKVMLLLAVNAGEDIIGDQILDVATKIIDSVISTFEDVNESIQEEGDSYYHKRIADLLKKAKSNKKTPPTKAQLLNGMAPVHRSDETAFNRSLSYMEKIGQIGRGRMLKNPYTGEALQTKAVGMIRYFIED
jgi:hypothetical protein